jgi:hypothetical protein
MEIHHQCLNAIGSLRAVDNRDVRMIQGGKRLRFTLESREAVGIARESVRENLDSDLSAQVGIGRPVYLAHATRAKPAGDFIRAEASTGSQHRPSIRNIGDHHAAESAVIEC